MVDERIEKVAAAGHDLIGRGLKGLTPSCSSPWSTMSLRRRSIRLDTVVHEDEAALGAAKRPLGGKTLLR